MKTIKIYANLHCASCEIKITDALKKDVEDLKINVASGLIKVKFDESKIEETEIKARIEKLGYEVTE